MALDDQKREFYETTLNTAREEIEALDRNIERELSEVKAAVGELEEERAAVLAIYRNACRLIGIEGELDEDGNPRSGRSALSQGGGG